MPLAQAVARAMPADALALFDGGHTRFWSNDFTPVLSPRTRFHEPGMCQLGFGLPRALGGFELGCDLSGTDHAAIGRGFGRHGEVVHPVAEVGPAIARTLANGLPAAVDAHCRVEPHPSMPEFGRMNRFGFDAPGAVVAPPPPPPPA